MVLTRDDRRAARELRLHRLARGLIEVAVLVVAFVAAFAYRFAFPLPAFRVSQMLWFVPLVIPLGAVALRLAGAHRHSWRYVGIRDVRDIVVATSGVAVVLLALRFLPGVHPRLSVPIGVTLANWVTSTTGLAGVRMLRRLLAERRESAGRATTGGHADVRRVVLVGAGRAGVMVANDLQRRPELRIAAVGFVDDDTGKHGRRIAGLDVLGGTEALAAIASATGATEAVITMAAVSRSDVRRIVELCNEASLSTQIIPGLYELVGSGIDVDTIRPVAVEDLLGRDPVELDTASLHELIGGKVVLITGAGGSIGSELARQAARFGPARLVLFERSEPALWAIDREIRAAYPHMTVAACIGDVTDAARVGQAFTEHRPELVVHAAAHKHVPMMEQHPGEAVKNNVGGTKVVVDAAMTHDVGCFVLVSTDKAVNPSSVMGATKRICERYVQHVAAETGKRFVAVRFGNVLGSTGSVVPIFQQQVAAGGPVTVTHPDMVRYFMTIPEASGLILQATALGTSGEILVLDMGEPVRIAELAENVIRLSGLEPGVDIAIEYTGLRPGEKMFEELSLEDEHAERTRHPKVWIGGSGTAWRSAETDLANLIAISNTSADGRDVVDMLGDLVPEFSGGRGSSSTGVGHAAARHD